MAELDDVTGREGVAERDDCGEGDECGVRDALGDQVEAGPGGVGAGVVVELYAGGAVVPGAGTGRTRKYTASTARNRMVSTMVEVRGLLVVRLTGRPRPAGRCRGRPGR